MFFRHTQQYFSLRKNLAHLVEQLSVKQCVVGSIPSILSFVPSQKHRQTENWTEKFNVVYLKFNNSRRS